MGQTVCLLRKKRYPVGDRTYRAKIERWFQQSQQSDTGLYGVQQEEGEQAARTVPFKETGTVKANSKAVRRAAQGCGSRQCDPMGLVPYYYKEAGNSSPELKIQGVSLPHFMKKFPA